jgi:hypothetical protein
MVVIYNKNANGTATSLRTLLSSGPSHCKERCTKLTTQFSPLALRLFKQLERE